MTARYRKPPRYRTPALIVLGLLVFAAASYPLARLLRDDAADRARAHRPAPGRAEGGRARAAAHRPQPGPRARASRSPTAPTPSPSARTQVTDAEAQITADGRRRAAEGTIDRDIKGAECFPYPRTARARARSRADPRGAARPLRVRRLLDEVRGARVPGPGAHGPLRLPLLARDRVPDGRPRVVQGHAARRRGRAVARRRPGARAVPRAGRRRGLSRGGSRSQALGRGGRRRLGAAGVLRPGGRRVLELAAPHGPWRFQAESALAGHDQPDRRSPRTLSSSPLARPGRSP